MQIFVAFHLALTCLDGKRWWWSLTKVAQRQITRLERVDFFKTLSTFFKAEIKQRKFTLTRRIFLSCPKIKTFITKQQLHFHSVVLLIPWIHSRIFFCSIRAYKACFASSCTAQIIFTGRSVVFHLHEETELSTHYWFDRDEKKNSPAPGRTQNHNFNSFALQACAQLRCYNRGP